MGRTNPTYRDTLRALEQQWGDYRRALRRRDQARFDRLFEHARRGADAASYLNHEDPMRVALVSIALGQQAEIEALEARVDALEERGAECGGGEQ